MATQQASMVVYTFLEDCRQFSQSFNRDLGLRVFVGGHRDDSFLGLDINGYNLVLKPTGLISFVPVLLGPEKKRRDCLTVICLVSTKIIPCAREFYFLVSVKYCHP